MKLVLAATLCLLCGCAREVDDWILAADSPDAHERLMAVHALGRRELAQQSPAAVIRVLDEARSEVDVRVREQARISLWHVRPGIMGDLLMRVCSGEGQEDAGRELLAMGARAFGSLDAALADARCGAPEVIAEILFANGAAGIEVLARKLLDADPTTQGVILDAFTRHGPRARLAQPVVEICCERASGELRGRAEAALAAMR